MDVVGVDVDGLAGRGGLKDDSRPQGRRVLEGNEQACGQVGVVGVVGVDVDGLAGLAGLTGTRWTWSASVCGWCLGVFARVYVEITKHDERFRLVLGVSVCWRCSFLGGEFSASLFYSSQSPLHGLRFTVSASRFLLHGPSSRAFSNRHMGLAICWRFEAGLLHSLLGADPGTDSGSHGSQ